MMIRRLRSVLLFLLVIAISLLLTGDRPAHAPSRPIPITGGSSGGASDAGAREVPAAAKHLVDLAEYIPDLILEIRYAREDNFFGRVMYPVARALCTRGTAEKLARAQRLLAASGYRLILWDSYRPQSVQRHMWQVLPDSRYVANPSVGSKHSRAAAVDVSLADLDGNPLKMPTEFDHFGPEARPSWQGHPAEVKARAKALADVMRAAGFIQGTTEWWHFVDAEYGRYPLLDLPLDVPVPPP